MEADHINFGKLATHTALAFTVEQDNHQIQQLRQKYDPAFQRWQPHINICFPFVDKPFFDHVFNLLQEQFKQFPSFEVKFKSMDYFPHGTVFLVPQTDSNQFCLIQQKIVNVFPQLKGNKQFHPHMTVGKFNKGEVAKRKDELGSVWKEWTVKVDGISIIERGKDTPFKTFRKIKFAQNKKQ